MNNTKKYINKPRSYDYRIGMKPLDMHAKRSIIRDALYDILLKNNVTWPPLR